jgi:CheY-like chemotaxis protein
VRLRPGIIAAVVDETNESVRPESVEELERLKSMARDACGPAGFLVANVGFALEELAALSTELAAPAGDETAARFARAQSALSAVTDALREARTCADQLRRLTRTLAGLTSESGRPATTGDGRAVFRDASSPPSRPSPSLPRGRVLVVDDEPMIVRAIHRLLETEHEVSMSTDPLEAVETVRAGRRFDIILCDLMMPTMCGVDVYDAIRQIDGDQARRMVFMTGGAFTPRVVRFLETNENARIEKPLERTSLRAAIRAQIESLRP